MDTIADIIRKFDIIAIQEIRDKEDTAINKLLSVVNHQSNDYALVLGTRLGRTSSKEQYAFFYRTSLIEAEKEPITWQDSNDQFEREPFLAMFKAKNGKFDFVLVDIHTKPEDATREIALLPTVILYGANHYGDPDVLCLGDWNADGSYYNESGYLASFPQDKFIWLIPNSADTTIAKQSNTYDRMAGTVAMQEDWTGEWGVYRFDEVEGFKEKGIKPLDISDHYPVWAEFWIDKDTD
jgi:endonuclease/exonuclease/phosphatase family metal-dependent hydrolase